MKRVLFGTPCYDGKVNVEFMQALLMTMPLAAQNGIELFPIQIMHDALVQRARNDLVHMAIEAKCDDIVFMDSDQIWNPEWIIKLLNHPVDVVGCPVPKKSDAHIDFNIQKLDGEIPELENGLMEVRSVGTGCLRISSTALKQVYDASPTYTENGVEKRMVFDVQLRDSQIISEDVIFCDKYRALGGKIWVDPSMTCGHIGVKTFGNNFAEFIAKHYKS